ncbi:MAG: hypothetical protein FJ138_16065 [Deltaproteobacteria bacterium]|nr:hypothetical protein [Deltaproteobacteria bacterium]
MRDSDDSDDSDDTLDPSGFSAWCDQRLRATSRAAWALSRILDAYEEETGEAPPPPSEALAHLAERFEVDGAGGQDPLIAAARRY